MCFGLGVVVVKVDVIIVGVGFVGFVVVVEFGDCGK